MGNAFKLKPRITLISSLAFLQIVFPLQFPCVSVYVGRHQMWVLVKTAVKKMKMQKIQFPGRSAPVPGVVKRMQRGPLDTAGFNP